ncbi:MAG: HD domain-containing protein [Desulfovibrionaceae bacterium]
MNIHRDLLEFVFSGASLRRWNDMLRPTEFFEIDRQGHKMLIAWLLFLLETKNTKEDEKICIYQELVERAMFDYFFNLATTDIKPTIFNKIKQNEEDYTMLLDWGIKIFSEYIAPMGTEFVEKSRKYLSSPCEEKTVAENILRSASLYSTYWEFSIIKEYNTFNTSIASIEKEIIDKIKEQQGVLPSFSLLFPLELSDATELSSFAKLCGQLRFQKRWSQVSRSPETSVLGHMFLVGCYSYLYSYILGASTVRACNNFFSGLLHDLPELLTQDIISPVKYSSQSIARLIKEYEDSELILHIFTPLEREYKYIVERLQYMLGYAEGSEFYSLIIKKDGIHRVSFGELQTIYNSDCFDPKDGVLIKFCDTLCAFLEVTISIANGITSTQVEKAEKKMKYMLSKGEFAKILNSETPIEAGVEDILLPIVSSLMREFH